MKRWVRNLLFLLSILNTVMAMEGPRQDKQVTLPQVRISLEDYINYKINHFFAKSPDKQAGCKAEKTAAEIFRISKSCYESKTLKANQDASQYPSIIPAEYIIWSKRGIKAMVCSTTFDFIKKIMINEINASKLNSNSLLDYVDSLFSHEHEKDFYALIYLNCLGLKTTFLGLDNGGIVSVPFMIGEFSKLKHISLKNNLLSFLPHTMSGLINLKSVNLSNNNFQTLPPFIGRFKELKELYVQNNPLIDLPGEILNLDRLYLIDTQRTRLPIGLQGLFKGYRAVEDFKMRFKNYLERHRV